MSECRNSITRMIVKSSATSGVIPTVPASDNHQDGSWIATDIYKGEFFFNKADGLLFTRDDTGIKQVETKPAGSGEYVAIVTQSGTSAPTANVLKDTIGGITWGYSAVGQYTADADAGGIFAAGNYGGSVGSFDSLNDRALLYKLDDDTLRLDTYVSAVATNGVLNDTLVQIYVELP